MIATTTTTTITTSSTNILSPLQCCAHEAKKIISLSLFSNAKQFHWQWFANYHFFFISLMKSLITLKMNFVKRCSLCLCEFSCAIHRGVENALTIYNDISLISDQGVGGITFLLWKEQWIWWDTHIFEETWIHIVKPPSIKFLVCHLHLLERENIRLIYWMKLDVHVNVGAEESKCMNGLFLNLNPPYNLVIYF